MAGLAERCESGVLIEAVPNLRGVFNQYKNRVVIPCGMTSTPRPLPCRQSVVRFAGAARRQIMEKLSFGGHETFPFRYLWPAKGVRGVVKDPNLFGRDDAVVTLGVGKNMVRSIRYWCVALRLVEEGDGRGAYRPTDLGERLASEDGWDPYLEDPATLWLLHWQLTSRPAPASAFHLLFGHWPRDHAGRDELCEWLLRWAVETSARATAASMRRDVEVMLRTHLGPANARRLAEEGYDSPLVELGLLRRTGNGCTLARGWRPSLPRAIFEYALLDSLGDRNEEVVPLEALLYGPGSVGMCFRLSEAALVRRLEALPVASGLQYDETAGMRMLLGRPRPAFGRGLDLLTRHYETEPRERNVGREVA